MKLVAIYSKTESVSQMIANDQRKIKTRLVKLKRPGGRRGKVNPTSEKIKNSVHDRILKDFRAPPMSVTTSVDKP